jgi:flavodoxin
MKKFLVIVTTFFCVAGLYLEAQTTSNGKILVAYFSWSGNAKVLAEQVARETGGDLFEIKTVKKYPAIYDECSRMAREEQILNARPALSERVSNIAQYDTIFLCSPNWWRTLPMGVFTFLESYNFSGKKIYPLITHGRDGFGSILGDMQKICPEAVIGEGITINFYDRDPTDSIIVETPNSDVSTWLHELGMPK